MMIIQDVKGSTVGTISHAPSGYRFVLREGSNALPGNIHRFGERVFQTTEELLKEVNQVVPGARIIETNLLQTSVPR